ncbi:MAG: carboxylating nicotinate-nucleotide diphosphorylase [Desulfosalsimonadaceae bacterium]
MRIPFCRHVARIIEMAIDEDVGHGDITTECLDLGEQQGQGEIRAKERLVLAGLDLVGRVFQKIDPAIVARTPYNDGDIVDAGTTVLTAKGSMAGLLIGERTALNFLQRLSGIATHVRQYADILADSPVRLVDTRKTVPGWRVLEKYAVRVGGAYNHRMGLYDGVLIKDNHIAAAGGISPAVFRIRKKVSHLVRVEVETSTLSEVEEAMSAGADVIMLDNMADSEIEAAVALVKGRALLEVSGRVDRDRIAFLAATGIDIISSGALTHAARFVDLSMDVGCS